CHDACQRYTVLPELLVSIGAARRRLHPEDPQRRTGQPRRKGNARMVAADTTTDPCSYRQGRKRAQARGVKRRREFISLLGSAAAAWPISVRAQQPAMPVIGFLDSRSSDAMGSRLGGFRQGLKELGFAEGENVAVAYPWAEDRLDRLPEMAAELVSRQPTVIVTTGGPTTALAAKAATTTIPIVFLVGEDPISLGLVSSIARPSGNLTGINLFANELEAKRLELLHQLGPQPP